MNDLMQYLPYVVGFAVGVFAQNKFDLYSKVKEFLK